ncbi:hypothetical protein AOX59_16670 [Lentibacillus amyloliquefaciens]|uniref:Uncharacterized protein n=1 Tax=Lentibacillus amyloliquefaciens TaxID=1472767 RepID=A0A0U4FQT7_9BACI|nr:hypothetical protein AOX59_16670 [Lentibacillus amyloliquefaciens]
MLGKGLSDANGRRMKLREKSFDMGGTEETWAEIRQHGREHRNIAGKSSTWAGASKTWAGARKHGRHPPNMTDTTGNTAEGRLSLPEFSMSSGK